MPCLIELLDAACPLRRAIVALARVCVLLAASLLAGCASTAAGVGIGVLGKSLELLGLKAPQSAEEAKAMVPLPPPKLTLRLHAGDQLNTDDQMRSLSVVVRVYKLRRLDAFLSAPYTAFGEATGEKTAFGDDLFEVRELVMRPGQRHEVVETMANDVPYIAVVALFRAPSEGRWRFAFDAKQAEKSGVTLGLHGCAMSVAAGVAQQAPPELLRLAGVRCL